MGTIHFIIAISTVLLVLYSDEQAFMWMLGKKERMSAGKVLFLHRAITLCLILLILTGGFIYAQAPIAYFSLSAFITKMIVVFALIVNTYAIDRFSAVAITRSFASLSHKERIPLLITGAISFAGWATAFVCGLLIA